MDTNSFIDAAHKITIGAVEIGHPQEPFARIYNFMGRSIDRVTANSRRCVSGNVQNYAFATRFIQLGFHVDINAKPILLFDKKIFQIFQQRVSTIRGDC